ncbi:MAG: hypothetical protein ACPG05_02515, partial [Bdellovibrionales bacterium]
SDVMRSGNEKFSLKSKWRQENRDVCFEHEMAQIRKMQGSRVPQNIVVTNGLSPFKDTRAFTASPDFYGVAPADLSDYCELTPYEYRQEIEAPRDEVRVQQRLQEYKAV